MNELLIEIETITSLLAEKNWQRGHFWASRNGQQISCFFMNSNSQSMVIVVDKPANNGPLLVAVRVNNLGEVRKSNVSFIDACTDAFDTLSTQPEAPLELGVSLNLMGTFA